MGLPYNAAMRSILAAVACFLLLAPAAWAGGGPETTLVVANAEDPTSVRIAGAYARLRDLPPRHVLYLEGVPASPRTDVKTFRERILVPIEAYLAAEGLEDAIDCIAYSTGFPYGVSFDADAKAKSFQVRPPISRTASLTGLTYFHRHVMAEDPAAYLSLTANRYFRRDAPAVPPGAERFDAEDAARVRAYREGLRTKDYETAARALEALLADYPRIANFWYDLACCRARLEQDDAAMAALEKAVEEGFREADHAERDPDLERLRGRDRFGELVAAMREARKNLEPVGALAFTAATAWDQEGNPEADARSPHRYRLAVMLGWTGAHGNTPREVLAALERARGSDATFPDGTVYLMKNKDVRSTTRAPWFEAVKRALTAMGRKAEVLDRSQPGQDGRLPRGRFDAIGIVAGSAGLSWRATDRPLLPGGIGEHLTSFGAHFGTGSQTKCTEFFRHGAAGTSGTVAEPYAIPHKFPSPWMHVHYARGFSLAEAFYLSVWGPYQLLVLGDPLCRPFAQPAGVEILAPQADAPLEGEVAVDVAFDLPPGVTLETKELWVDGRRVHTGPARDLLSWDTRTVCDGAHELRVVGVEAGPVATRSHAARWVAVDNGTGTRVDVETPEPVRWGEALRLRGRAKGVAFVDVVRGTQVLGTAAVKRGRWQVELDPLRLGLGTSRLQVQGRGEKGEARSFPVEVAVLPPEGERPGRTLRGGDTLPGVHVRWTDAKGDTHESVAASLSGIDAKGAASLRLDGSFRVPPAEDAATIRVRGPREVTLRIGEGVVDLRAAGEDADRYAILPLGAGWHDFVLEASGAGLGGLAIELGGVRPRSPLAGGDLAWIPEDWIRADRPSTVILGEDGDPDLKLWDGKRGGDAATVDAAAGLVVKWEDRQKDVLAVALHAATGKDAPALPEAWVVERRTSERGRWRAVEDLEVVVARGVERRGKGAEAAPAYVLLRFDETTARELRIRRPEGENGKVQVAEVEVFVED